MTDLTGKGNLRGHPSFSGGIRDGSETDAFELCRIAVRGLRFCAAMDDVGGAVLDLEGALDCLKVVG